MDFTIYAPWGICDTCKPSGKEEAFYLYAYCVMDNHIHLVIKEGQDSLARIIKRIGTSYAYYFNKKYKRIGHVFQDRFRSEVVEDDKYLLALIRYAHQNPLKSEISTIEGYLWSSYRDYLNQRKALVDREEILSMFSKSMSKALEEFARFNHETVEEIFLDIVEEKEIGQGNVKEYIAKFLIERQLEIGQLKNPSNKKIRNELIRLLLNKSSLSRRGIAMELGLSREMVRRISVSEEPSP